MEKVMMKKREQLMEKRVQKIPTAVFVISTGKAVR